MRHNDISMQKVKFLHLKLSALYIYTLSLQMWWYSLSDSILIVTYMYTFQYHEQFIDLHNNSLANMTNVNKYNSAWTLQWKNFLNLRTLFISPIYQNCIWWRQHQSIVLLSKPQVIWLQTKWPHYLYSSPY